MTPTEQHQYTYPRVRQVIAGTTHPAQPPVPAPAPKPAAS